MVLTVTHPSSVSSLRSSTPVPLLALRATSPGAGESFPQGVKASAETASGMIEGGDAIQWSVGSD